ncbi:MAG: response regulator [Burkholderiales bacterium]|nr:response regulator [Burkholderiales bacterium]
MGKRVLIVDDNRTNIEICTEQLRGLGTLCVGVQDGSAALHALRAAVDQRFDLIILDMNMPAMNGLEVARLIQADPALCGTPRIMLSSVGDSWPSATLAAVGIARVITKPARQAELQACVTEVLGERVSAACNACPLRTPTGFSGKILVAEDNEVNQLVARAMLRSLGLDCDVCPDGESAVHAWSEGSYDAILMDCQMPNVDGFEAAGRIRALESERGGGRIPIIALTANVVGGVREACAAAGMDDYLSKPYTEHALAEALRRWLPSCETAC